MERLTKMLNAINHFHQQNARDSIPSNLGSDHPEMTEEVSSVRTRGQNNEIRFRMIAYNATRIAKLRDLFGQGVSC